jgi:hypothetical protein
MRQHNKIIETDEDLLSSNMGGDNNHSNRTLLHKEASNPYATIEDSEYYQRQVKTLKD